MRTLATLSRLAPENFRSLRCRLSGGQPSINAAAKNFAATNVSANRLRMRIAHVTRVERDVPIPAPVRHDIVLGTGAATGRWLQEATSQEKEICLRPDIGLPYLRPSCCSAAPAVRLRQTRAAAPPSEPPAAPASRRAAPPPRRPVPTPQARASLRTRQHVPRRPERHRLDQLLHQFGSEHAGQPVEFGQFRPDRRQWAAVRHGGHRRRNGRRHLEQPGPGHRIDTEPTGHDRLRGQHWVGYLRLRSLTASAGGSIFRNPRPARVAR